MKRLAVKEKYKMYAGIPDCVTKRVPKIAERMPMPM